MDNLVVAQQYTTELSANKISSKNVDHFLRYGPPNFENQGFSPNFRIFPDFLMISEGYTQQYTHEPVRLGEPDRLASILLALIAAQGR